METAKEIVKRFLYRRDVTGLNFNRSAHHLAIAMNRIGGKSNTGEGGEDAARFNTSKGSEKLSDVIGNGRIFSDRELLAVIHCVRAFKQVASGRLVSRPSISPALIKSRSRLRRVQSPAKADNYRT